MKSTERVSDENPHHRLARYPLTVILQSEKLMRGRSRVVA